MKYLVIGDSSSMHIFNFVKTILLPQKYEVHLLTLSSRDVHKEYMEFYNQNGVIVHSIAMKKYKNIEKKDYIHRILNIWRKLKLMKDIPSVDICHVQSVYKTALIMILINRQKYKKLILSYWGGDIEDKSFGVIKLRERCFKFADVITVTVKQTYKEFQKIYGNKYNNKLYICRFATSGLDYIHNLRKKVTRNECREEYNIPKDKICITCGYSAYAEQHQDRCLEIIRRLDKKIREKIIVIIPMQYGRYNMEYIQKVKKIAQSCDFTCIILEKFVPFEMSVKLAISTDIYLHLRDTDAFSNALKEHVYAGSYIIKGDWLEYPELEEMGAAIESIFSFDDLKNTLEKVINRVVIDEEIKLFDPIFKLYSTKAIIEQWSKIIKLVLNKDRSIYE